MYVCMYVCMYVLIKYVESPSRSTCTYVCVVYLSHVKRRQIEQVAALELQFAVHFIDFLSRSCTVINGGGGG
jgi:hypothetical protein